MNRNTFLNAILFAIIGGIFLLYLVGESVLAFLVLALIVGVFFPFLYFSFRKDIFLICIFVCISALFSIYYSAFFLDATEQKLSYISQFEGRYLSYEGKVQGVHARDDFYDTYVIELQKIDGEDIPYSLEHLLKIPKNFHLEIADMISYQGKMYLFEDFNGFSYQQYMLSKDLYFSASTSKVDRISDNNGGFLRNMSDIREGLLSRMSTIFPEHEAIFLGGILFGARENIPDDLKEDFNNSGLTHFIAVSGFNITLCILFTTFFFSFLPTWGRIIAVTTTIVIFCIFVGLGAPVVRAAIMGILGYIISQHGRTQKNLTLLLFTAVCMGLYNPASLLYDVSLHLSFLAVMGIIYTQEYFKKLFFWVPKTFAIREACVLTLSALSFALPIMMFQFGQVSLLAPFANIAVTWTIPLAMLGGSLTLIVHALSPFLGEIFGFFTWMLLHYDILMVRFFGNIDFALWQINVGAYGIYLQTLYFIVLVYILSYLHFRNKKQPF